MAVTEKELKAAQKREWSVCARLRWIPSCGVETMPKHVFFAWCYRNASFLRLKGLERSIAACLAANEPVSAVILARQFVETAAHYISTTLYIEKQLRKSPPDLLRIDERLGSRCSGASCPRWSTATRPNRC
jgi:hypothetical protein